jgi:hypothetical protein
VRGALLAGAAAALFVLAGCGSSHAPSRARTTPRFALGVTEYNPALVWSTAARPTVPTGFMRWRATVAALHPAYDRVLVDWAQLQPDPAHPADLATRYDGCVRGIAPCAPYAGLRDQLAAIASQQRAQSGGWQVVLVLSGVPAWAAHRPTGCERRGAAAVSRPVTRRGLVAYRALISAIVALGRREHVALRWWAPWNEPDHPAFISPQRATCAMSGPLLSAAVYAQLVRAAQAQLRADRQRHRLVLGELAGFTQPTRYVATGAQLVAALPRDVACTPGAVWSVHSYARPTPAPGPDPLRALEQALDARACTRGAPIWVDESGAGNRRGDHDPSRRDACVALAADLARWRADPRVRAAFQFSLRDDPAFPVGLFATRLTHAWPSLGVWQALAAGRVPAPADCSRIVSP